jgi:hypothetical protein
MSMPALMKVARLFVIKSRLEAFAVIYALSLGAIQRGKVYLDVYPGIEGQLLFLACTGAVFMAGAAILDSVRFRTALRAAAVFERRT